jgi:hypothetical protein
MQRDREGYWMKVGIYTTASTPPTVAVNERGASQGIGSAKSNPTTVGLPGPLPTLLRFPDVGCWQVTAKGVTGNASILVHVTELPLR